MGDMNWRGKDDLDLTSDDIDDMIAEAQPVAVRGPDLPAGAPLVEAVPPRPRSEAHTSAKNARPGAGR